MSKMKTKQEIVVSFIHWFKSKDLEELKQYVRRGALNRSEIAKELGFARSVWGSNKRLAKALRGADKRLKIGLGISVDVSDSDNSEKVEPKRDRSAAKNREQSQRIRQLETKVADLTEKLRVANEKLEKFEAYEEYIFQTGRAPRP